MDKDTPQPPDIRAHDADGNVRPADARFLSKPEQKKKETYIEKVSGKEAADIERARAKAVKAADASPKEEKPDGDK